MIGLRQRQALQMTTHFAMYELSLIEDRGSLATLRLDLSLQALPFGFHIASARLSPRKLIRCSA
ncbi:MAG: hypothetical protein FJZ90_18385 [Chloroflexi bacterium]|nr:hypothetical protein [Chloroflexota bacterium]